MKKHIWLVTLLLSASFILSACAQPTAAPVEAPVSQEPAAQGPATEAPAVQEPATEAPATQEHKILRFGVTNDVSTLDSAMMTISPDWNIATALYSALVTYKPGVTAEVQPDLAESWDISEDELVWTFHLRKGAQWHRGYGEVTAKDVVFTYERVKNPETGSPYINDLKLIEEIEAVDDYTVRFTFSAPSPTFLSTVAAYRPGRILNQQALEDFGENYNQNAVGSGPFMLDHWTSGSELVLVKNPDHWDAETYKLDGITWKIVQEESVAVLALQAGDLDIFFPSDPDAMKTLKETPGMVLRIDEGTNHVRMFINTEREPFNDVRVRRAMNHAYDQKAMLEYLGESGGEAKSEIAPFMFGYTDDVVYYDYDPEKAKQLLAEAGYPNGVDVHLLGTNWGPYAPAAEIVADMLTQVGFKVNLEILEGGIYYGKLGKGEFDAAVSGIGRTDPHQILYRYHTDNIVAGVNTVRISNPELDKLLDAQYVTLNEAERRKQIEDIQKLLREQATTVPLFIGQQVTAHWDYVTGVVVGAQAFISWDMLGIEK